MTAPGGGLVQGRHGDPGGLLRDYVFDLFTQEEGRGHIEAPGVQRVTFLDGALAIDPEHEVRQGVEGGLQAVFGVAQLILDTLAVGDIEEGGQQHVLDDDGADHDVPY